MHSAGLSEWPSPSVPPSHQFSALCHHVDWSGHLHLSPWPESEDTLDRISVVLDTMYRGSKPRPTDLYWSQGELCIAQFSVDSKWYR